MDKPYVTVYKCSKLMVSTTLKVARLAVGPVKGFLPFAAPRCQRHSSALPQSALQDLKRILDSSSDQVLQKEISISNASSVLENAAHDASSYSLIKPDVCLIPRNTLQVSKCVQYCYANDIPMVPVGARTGLEGGIHAMRGGVSFDMTAMKRIIQLNENDLDCHVEAGLSWRELNESIKSTGLWFPVDPGASASLGGMAATSASGTNAVKFGTMKENVIGLEVVTADGHVVNTHGESCRSRKTSAGLNLTNLFVGSEGILGIITSVKLKIHALPSSLAVATVGFSDVKSAADSVVQIMQCGLPIARLEFLDQAGVQACYHDSGLPQLCPDGPMLFVELHGISERDIKDQAELLHDIFETNQAKNFFWTSKFEERTQLWKARHGLHWSILKTKPGFLAIDTDVCVPISCFPEMIIKTQELIREYNLSAPLMGHAGDGNFHSVILYDPNKLDDFVRAKELATEMGKIAISLDGTVTGEHGVGRGKMDLLEEQFNEASLELMCSIKRALDPKNLFNPDKVLKDARLSSRRQA